MTKNSANCRLCECFLVLLALGGTSLCATGLGNNTPVPLNVLLINDDGIGAEGIESMQAALEGAGHYVIVVAPNGNASGSSASANFGEVFLIESADEADANDPLKNEFQVLRITEDQAPLPVPVPATPIDVVVMSPAVTPFVPDLVVSGINDGHNYGLLSYLSGTVAGALVSSTKVCPFGRLPAISVSLESVTSPLPPPADFVQNFDEVADFVVELIEALQVTSHKGELLPEGTFLSVNYPALDKEKIQGIRITRQGDSVLVGSVAFPEPMALQGLPLNPYSPSEFCDISATGGLCVAGAIPVPNNETVAHADTSAVTEGHISVALFEADYSAGHGLSELHVRLRTLLR